MATDTGAEFNEGDRTRVKGTASSRSTVATPSSNGRGRPRKAARRWWSRPPNDFTPAHRPTPASIFSARTKRSA